MTDVIIDKVNEVYIKVRSEPHIEREIYELFKFHVPQSKFINRMRKTRWDGYIHLYSLKTKQIYYGLLDKILDYCKENQYNVQNNVKPNTIKLTEGDYRYFLNSLNLSKQPRDYQEQAFKDCVRDGRSLTLSPTGSGKSLLIYMLAQFYTNVTNKKTLIIVPTTTLVHQMADDFESYGYTKPVHRITAGVTKTTDCEIVITTWQSLHNCDSDWYEQFDCVFFDEAHLCKAKVLTSILTSLKNCKYRFGFTGTLDNVDVNILTLEGLFNTQNKVITTHELIERKQLADLKIKILVLDYNQDIRKIAKKYTYQDEIDFLINSQDRNNFITNLVSSLDGNTLVLYDRVDSHGKVLYNMIKQNKVESYFVHGGVEGQERNLVRQKVEDSNQAVIVASFGVFSTGVSIVNLHNIVYASPTKSKIRNLQSIGRGLRVSDQKKTATLYDIADDLSYKNKRNYTLNHLLERVKNYDNEQFQYKIINVPINRL